MSDNHDYLQGMKRKVGWFILIGMGALIFMLVITGARSNVFAKKFYVHIEPPTAASFHEGLPVRFQGFAIGHVDTVELQEQGKVRVTLQLLDKYRQMLHQGATVEVAKEGMFGEQFVQINAGDTTAPVLEDQVTVAFESEVSLSQLLEDLQPSVAHVDQFLEEMVKLGSWLNDPYGSVRTNFAQMQQFTQGLKGDELTRLMAELRTLTAQMKQEKLVKNLSHMMGSAADTLDKAKPFSDELGQQGGKTLASLNALMQRMEKLAVTLDAVSADVAEASPEFPALAAEFRQSLVESQMLMKSVRKSWLFGDNSEAQSTQQGSSETMAVDLRP